MHLPTWFAGERFLQTFDFAIAILRWSAGGMEIGALECGAVVNLNLVMVIENGAFSSPTGFLIGHEGGYRLRVRWSNEWA